MRSIEQALIFRKGVGEIRQGNMFFEKNNFTYQPVSDWFCDISLVSHVSSYLVNLEESLPLLKMSILDESLPLYVFGLLGLFAGGRVTDSMILGMMKYSDSLPELLESAQHDLNYEMRATSTSSIGDMKEKSWNMVPTLCRILLKDKSFYVKENVAEALGKIGNPLASNFLRNSFDETKSIIQSYELRGYPANFESNDPWERRDADSACMLLENCLRSLFKLNSLMGREALSEGLNGWSNTVYHWSKRAAFWQNYYDCKRI